MANNTVFNAERMESTNDVNLLRSGRYQVSSTDTAVDNGALVSISGFVSGERDLHTCIAPAAITTTNLYIVDGVEIVYSEETVNGLDDFQNIAGANARLRRPRVGDYFAISAPGIDPLTTADAIAVGSLLIPAAGVVTMEEVAAAGGTESFVAEIMDTYVLGYDAVGGRQIKMFGCQVTKVL